MLNIRLPIVTCALMLGFTSSVNAEVKLGSIFGDHMVLQRDSKVCIWGEGDMNAEVQVRVASQSATTVVGKDCRWKVYLKPVRAGGPYALTVSTGNSTNVIDDVVFGDVWLCSGQSNMQTPVKECDAHEQETVLANKPNFRMCSVRKGWDGKVQSSAEIKWQTWTANSVTNFSAVACFFANELVKYKGLTNVPIAVIDSSFGGTTCEAWIPQGALANFSTNNLHDSMFGIKPSMIYNAMIAPLGESPIKGVLWYQGESNAGHPDTYPKLLSTMIAEWRKQFNTPKLPFYIVQLPDYANLWDGFYFQWEREAQATAVSVIPKTALVVGINTTDGFDLHPKQKLEIGRRAALLARQMTYKENVVAKGPVFKKAKIKGATVRVTFDSAGKGLACCSPEGIQGFAVAGDDQVYYFAKAKIEGDCVVLQADQVRTPKTVRYAWAGIPNSTLINKAGLPAAPFRTDTFPVSNVEVQKNSSGRRVASAAYELTVDRNGRLTSFLVKNMPMLVGGPNERGETTMATALGFKLLNKISCLAPEQLSCSDGEVSLFFKFKEQAMEWVLNNQGKDAVRFSIPVASQVTVTGQPNSGLITLAREKALLTIHGIDEVSGNDGERKLHVVVPGGGSKRLDFQIGKE